MGLASSPAAVTVNVTKAVADGAVTVDGEGVVLVGGTSGDDVITITHTSDNQNLEITINGVVVSNTIPVATVAEVRAWSREGHDDVEVVDLALDTMLHGGEGDDYVSGGAGEDLIFGGIGDDTLIGGDGNDFLFGGGGSDRIVGSAGHDILVAGSLACSYTESALRQILADWASNFGEDDGTADDMLDETLVTDGSYDMLTGSSGHDWFIISDGDKITDIKAKKGTDDLVTVV